MKKYTAYPFKSGRGMPHAIIVNAAVDKGAIGFGGENIVELRLSGAGGVYPASATPGTPDKFDQNVPTYTYIIGTDNYDGLRRIYNLRAGRHPQIYAPFVAETPVGAFVHVGYKAEVASEFGGFSVHFASPSTAVDLEVTLHSAKGAAWDTLLYSYDMDGIQDINRMFEPPRYLAPGDRLDLTYPATLVFAVLFYIRKLG